MQECWDGWDMEVLGYGRRDSKSSAINISNLWKLHVSSARVAFCVGLYKNVGGYKP